MVTVILDKDLLDQATMAAYDHWFILQEGPDSASPKNEIGAIETLIYLERLQGRDEKTLAVLTKAYAMLKEQIPEEDL